MFDIRDEGVAEKTRREVSGSFEELSAGVTHYELLGDSAGPTVVLIHGNAAPYATWDHSIEDLTVAGLTVLRYDVFGHGFSDRPKLRRYGKDLYNAQLAGLLEALDIAGPIRLVGTSQGGSIAAGFVATNPGKVTKLALLSPLFDDFVGSRGVVASLVGTPIAGEVLLKLVSDRKLVDLSGKILSPEARAVLEADVIEQFRIPGKRRAILANWRGNPVADAAASYEAVRDQGIPTLITWGTFDKSIPGDSMARLRDLLPDAEYHELDGAGHLAHYEFPERINPLLVRFLTA